jgi:type I restriction enzyme R subunit
MERAVADDHRRQTFYERLSTFARTLKLALASMDFHTSTEPATVDRYRHDLKYFMSVRASVARRYAEVVDFKQYQGAIQKLLDTYVGAGDVETLVEPVDILNKEAFQKELDQIANPEGRAEVIANRVRQTIQDYRDKRFDQLELLQRMEDIRDRVRDRRAVEEVPAKLKAHDVARSYYDVVLDRVGSAGLTLDHDIAADVALRIEGIILGRKKVDWVRDTDVQNQMKTAIEDELFHLKDTANVELDYGAIDAILDRCIDIARRRLA